MKLVYFILVISSVSLSYLAGFQAGYNRASDFKESECNKLMEHTYGKQ